MKKRAAEGLVLSLIAVFILSPVGASPAKAQTATTPPPVTAGPLNALVRTDPFSIDFAYKGSPAP